MNYIKDITLRTNKGFNVIIEINKKSKLKKELNEKKFDKLETVRKMKYAYPFYYGCFPQTFEQDGDPLDMVLLTNQKFDELEIVEVEIIGAVKTIDEGLQDDKILVVPVNEDKEIRKNMIYNAYKFLTKYKGKKSNTIVMDKFLDAEDAIKLINEASERFNVKNKSTSFKIIF